MFEFEDTDGQQDGLIPEDKLHPPRQSHRMTAHKDVEQSLLRDYHSGHLPHAFIFSGPEGIGKATMAFRFARFLLAEGGDEQGGGLFGDTAPPTTLHVAEDNPVSRRVASGGHADLLVIEPEFDEKKGRFVDRISVDEARRITPFLRKTSAEGGWRVVIVDGADKLNRNGQNAILKILEEPPKQTVLILVASSPASMVQTIRSRCRVVNFDTLQDSALQELLRVEHPDMAQSDMALLSALAEGSVGKALSLQSEGGIELYQSLVDKMVQLPNFNPVELHDFAMEVGRAGAEQSYNNFMDLLCWWIERMIRAKAKNEPLAELVSGEKDLYNRLDMIYGVQDWLDIYDNIRKMLRDTEFSNLDKRQSVMNIFWTMEKAA